ncbi:hypothetical protein LH407_11335 [Antiquaquibacter oligotrophicus]|nr:hypothetical protein LH407_11335 [Antiquaquibacter oligotrophicus]
MQDFYNVWRPLSDRLEATAPLIGALSGAGVRAQPGGSIGRVTVVPPGAVAPPRIGNFSNPTISPGPAWEWRGAPGSSPGGANGAWFNPTTRESLHPDLSHPAPIGPHWDWKSPDGVQYRVYEDGRIVPK